MQLVSTPTNTIKYIEASIAAKKTYNLEKKPAKGGTPAIENIVNAIVIASSGFILDKPIKSVKYLTRPDLFWKPKDRRVVQIQILIIMYKMIYTSKPCSPSAVPVAIPTNM